MHWVKCDNCGKIVKVSGKGKGSGKSGGSVNGEVGSKKAVVCPECGAEINKRPTMEERVCRECGKKFIGGPRAWYCPDCKKEIISEIDARRYRNGPQRKLGSIDQCEICGKEYVVKSSRQRYCKECAEKEKREYKRRVSEERRRKKKDLAEREKMRAKNRRKCPVCGKGIRPGGSAETCSEECANVLREYKERGGKVDAEPEESFPLEGSALLVMAVRAGIDVRERFEKPGSRIKDLVGQKFGELTVIGFTGECRKGYGAIWWCLCSCGRLCKKGANQLVSGMVNSCGCKRKGRRTGSDGVRSGISSGDVFGELTAIRPTEQRQRGSVVWECECSCGKTCYVASSNLKSGTTKSCGHLKGGANRAISVWMDGVPKSDEAVILTAEGNEGRFTCPARYRADIGNGVWFMYCRDKIGVPVCWAKMPSAEGGGGEDLAGTRFGRLVAVRPVKKQAGDNRHTMWFCKCDCGSVAIVSKNNLMRQTVSCGCVSRGPRVGGSVRAVCPGCGERFPIDLNGEKTPQFCPECASKYAGKNWKVCPVCRKLFPSPESDKTVTCSKECSAEWKRRMHEGVSNKWNEASKAKKREQGQTENLKMGTPAAMASPIAGRFETNQEAKIWTLVDPSGNEIVVRNLLMWARENTDKFFKPKGDKSAEQVVHGFYAIAQTLRGKRKTPATTYFGWTLKDLPREPEEGEN